MLYSIKHRTEYSYSKQVFFEPMTVKLRPSSNAHQHLIDFRIDIYPEPAGKSDIVDLYGNDSIVIWFNGLHSKLTINTLSKVKTLVKNPYNFIITSKEISTLPVNISIYNEEIIKPYITNEFQSKELKKLVASLLDSETRDTLRFSTTICSYIYDNFTQEIRETGEPYSPDETISLGRGSCRDLSVLLVEAFRIVNLPARYVSGYSYGTGENIEEELHSWTEIYIPGAGWKGFDPSLGLATDSTYIQVATGVSHRETAPVDGAYRGNDVRSELKYNVKIDQISE